MKAKSNAKKLTKEDSNILTEAIIETEERVGKFHYPEKFRKRLTYIIERKKIFFAGGMLIAATTFANVLNFAFSAFVGRILTLNDFSLISLMGSFYAFASLFIGPLSFLVNYRSGYLIGKFNDSVGYHFWAYIRKYAIYFGIGISLLWLISMPFLNIFFKTESLLFFISFVIIIFGGFAAGVDKGFLSARLFFGTLSLVVFIEPLIKILLAVILAWMHLNHFMYITIPSSFFIAFLLGWVFIITHKPQQRDISKAQKESISFPKKFFFVSFVSGLSTISFVSLDIVLAKHYLPSSDAGKYALVSLMGKTVYFLGGLATPFIVPLVSRDLGANKSTARTLYMLLFFTFALSFIGFLCFGVYGYITAPLLLGEKALSIIPYLTMFLFAMMCFTVSQIFITFYQMRNIYSFPVAGFLLSILQIILIVLNHASVYSIVLAMSFVGIANLVVLSLMHFQWKKVQLIENKLVSIFKGEAYE
jgi:O-antigen/teichoic acid export membrane protein